MNELPDYLDNRANSSWQSVLLHDKPLPSNNDFSLKGGGFCPKCNLAVEQASISDLNIKALKCPGCKGVWIRRSHLQPLAQWYTIAATSRKSFLFDDRGYDTWKVEEDAPLVNSVLGLIQDDNPTRNFPYATVSLIVLNTLTFILSLFLKNDNSLLLIPASLLSSPLGNIQNLLTSMFMHANLFHLVGNMYFLWVFGDNIEDRLGPVKYLLVYLTCGVVAGITHALCTNRPELPTLGASGAVSGILGGYLLLYPKVRISAFTMMYFRTFKFSAPVWFYLGVWFFGQQLLNVGLGTSGVAWYAHIGGFISGFIILLGLRGLRRL